MRCGVLQCVALEARGLHCVALRVAVCLQCVLQCALLCVALEARGLHLIAVCVEVCVAVRFSLLQCVALEARGSHTKR